MNTADPLDDFMRSFIEQGIIDKPDPIIIAAMMAAGYSELDATVKAILAHPWTHKNQGLAP